MSRPRLLESAFRLQKVNASTIEELSSKKEFLVADINQQMLDRPDILDLIGGDLNVDIMKDNHNNHIRFVISILQEPNPEVLTDTVIWVFRSYMSRGFLGTYWSAQINTWIKAFKKNLTDVAYRDLLDLYTWLGVNIPLFEMASAEDMNK